LRHPAHRVAKENSLHTSTRDDMPADHEAYSPPQRGVPRDPETAPDGPRLHT
jgi:hypothetical protein